MKVTERFTRQEIDRITNILHRGSDGSVYDQSLLCRVVNVCRSLESAKAIPQEGKRK